MSMSRSNVLGLGSCVLLLIGGVLIVMSLFLQVGCMLELKVKIDPGTFEVISADRSTSVVVPSVATPPA